MWKTIYIAHTEEQAKNKANADGKRLFGTAEKRRRQA